MGIAENLKNIKQQLPPKTRLIVVSKYRKKEEILAAYSAGQRIFAENRVQALLERYQELPKDIEWHLIGHLQTNKVKFIVPFISCIHSVDSLKLLDEIEKQASKNNRMITCLLQIYIANEETKFGLNENELYQLLEEYFKHPRLHVQLCGIVAMATYTNNQKQIDDEFKKAREIFELVKMKYFNTDPKFSELSIGMSSDYKIAINNGSTMLRIGSAVFENQ